MLNVYKAKNGLVLQYVEQVGDQTPMQITREAALAVKGARARGLPVAMAGITYPSVGMDQFLDVEVPDDLGEEEVVTVSTRKFKVVTSFLKSVGAALEVIKGVAGVERLKMAEDMLDAPVVLSNSTLVHCGESYAVRAIDGGYLVRRTFDRVQEEKRDESDEAPAWSDPDPLERSRREAIRVLQDNLRGPFGQRPTEVYGFNTSRELAEFLWLQLGGK